MKLDFYGIDLYVIDNAYTHEECLSILKDCFFSKQQTNKFGEQFVASEFRTDECATIDPSNCFDVLGRIQKTLPNAFYINPLIRVSKYDVGTKCGVHTDAAFNNCEYTVLVYLGTPSCGGQTRFHYKNHTLDIAALEGRMVIFEQNLVHESVVVEAGVKYSFRTDVQLKPSQEKLYEQARHLEIQLERKRLKEMEERHRLAMEERKRLPMEMKMMSESEREWLMSEKLMREREMKMEIERMKMKIRTHDRQD